MKKKPKRDDLRILPGMQVFDLRRGLQGKERFPPKLVTKAYRKFVAGYYETHQPSRALFIGHSIPYLVRNTSRHVACVLAGVWFRKHGKGAYGPFMGEVIRAANAVPTLQNLPRMRLRTRRHKEALAIAAHLCALKGGEFPFPGRELQERLLLPHPEDARRVIQYLMKVGALLLIKPGISRPEASKLGVKARAATYEVAGRS